MAKAIKFNLICDQNPIRTIEDLQNNFSVEDILAYYKNKLLHRWLHVRGYNTELDAISAITSTDSMDIIKELIHIFGISEDVDKIEESIYILKYLEERKERIAAYEKENYKVTSIIKDYKNGYQKLVEGILKNPYNPALIKANIKEIVTNYAWVLELNHRSLFNQLKNTSQLAVMCLLMNEISRKYYLPVEKKLADGKAALDTAQDIDKNMMFKHICLMIQRSDFAAELGKNLLSFSGVTDGYWKDLEPKGKKYMIISIDAGDYVRAAGKLGGDLSKADITNKFIILDGVDYKSNSNTNKLLYMEV